MKTCETCKWRSDDFTSVCVNGESDRRADFVSKNDTCERWEIGMITASIVYTDGVQDVRRFGAWHDFSRFVDENAGRIQSACGIWEAQTDGE